MHVRGITLKRGYLGLLGLVGAATWVFGGVFIDGLESKLEIDIDSVD